jgi:GDP-L-fucose synthase
MFKNRRILVTGGTGLIGRPLVELLIAEGAKVTIASLDDPSRAHPKAVFKRADLTKFENCMEVCKNIQDVFSLIGVKGSPAVTREKPASFFVPTITFNTNMMEAARRSSVERYLYTSTVGVYGPADVFHEDDVWKTFPSENDRFAGWAKRMGEMQAEAYRIEYGWKDISIVRPANVYGPYDNFDLANAMVVPSLIHRAVSGENPLTVWGDGTPVRDFIHARDCARGMMLVMERSDGKPVNLGSGIGISIHQLVDSVVNALEKKPEVVWDSSKPKGDAKRIMDVSRAQSLGFKPEISIEEGIRETLNWYRSHGREAGRRYDVFEKTKTENKR